MLTKGALLLLLEKLGQLWNPDGGVQLEEGTKSRQKPLLLHLQHDPSPYVANSNPILYSMS